jgi:hypothetical protein
MGNVLATNIPFKKKIATKEPEFKKPFDDESSEGSGPQRKHR